MNFLAHLYLSEPDDESLLGSLLGDFVKGSLDNRYSPAITRAIAQHRKIDVFTDAHPVVMRAKSRVTPERRRYAGIMTDVFFDHFLARHWRQFHDESLDEFTSRFYALLLSNLSWLPERLQHMAPHMARHDWLGSYAHLDAVRVALDRMGTRLRRENRLAGATDELETHYAEFESDFREFLPEVKAFLERATARAA
ncbi:MAG: ACP phosphodiesterase [Burkholderiales bacterium]